MVYAVQIMYTMDLSAPRCLGLDDRNHHLSEVQTLLTHRGSVLRQEFSTLFWPKCFVTDGTILLHYYSITLSD